MRTQAIGQLAAHAHVHAASSSWGNSIPTAAAVVGIAAGALAIGVPLYQSAAALLRRTILSRRALAVRLNRLACGTTAAYIDSLFGPPAFRRALAGGYEEYLYRTRHAWIQTIVNIADQSVDAFAVTVIDPRFKFQVRHLTNFQIDAWLGRARFSDIVHQPDGIRHYRGANRFMHAESYWFGNPGNYQVYVLAYNDAGTGRYTQPRDPSAGRWAVWESGRLREHPPGAPSDDPIPAWLARPRAHTTINTLLVCPGFGSAPQPPHRWWQRRHVGHQPTALTQHWIGADAGRVRVLQTPRKRRQARRRLRTFTR